MKVISPPYPHNQFNISYKNKNLTTFTSWIFDVVIYKSLNYRQVSYIISDIT
jgi:hypothetical protein